METVNAECSSCRGTGLYQGFCEPEGVAVVCLGCEGSGCEKLTYTPFTKRKGKRGVKTVRLSAGTFIAGPIGPTGGSITYQEFQQGKMPRRK